MVPEMNETRNPMNDRSRTSRPVKLIEKLIPNSLWGFRDVLSREVYLTFDDGPSPDATPKLLDFLKANRIQAAFFFRGDRMIRHPEIVLKAFDDGHTIGYHGFSHKRWLLLKTKDYHREIHPGRLPEELKKCLHSSPRLLRPPYGIVDPFTLRYCLLTGAKLVFWRLIVYDWDQKYSDRQIIHSLQQQVVPGDIVVLHDGNHRGSALPGILEQTIKTWKTMGIQPGQFSTLLDPHQ